MSFVLEGEQIVREGETRRPSVVWTDFSTVSTRGHEMYVNGTTVSGTYLSGTTSKSQNTITGPLVTFPVGAGGLTAVLESRCTASSQAWSVGIVYRILKPGSAR